MTSTTGNGMIAAGTLAGVIGLFMLPAALGAHPDTSLLILGACGVSLGSMIAASGIYVKARALQSKRRSAGADEAKNSTRRVRGGCDVCHGDSPVIHCKVHQVHLCGNCLTRHYDFRTCAYAPSTRGTSSANSAKARAAYSR